jgi:uncharacterized protein YggL (DUF469 family)
VKLSRSKRAIPRVQQNAASAILARVTKPLPLAPRIVGLNRRQRKKKAVGEFVEQAFRFNATVEDGMDEIVAKQLFQWTDRQRFDLMVVHSPDGMFTGTVGPMLRSKTLTDADQHAFREFLAGIKQVEEVVVEDFFDINYRQAPTN